MITSKTEKTAQEQEATPVVLVDATSEAGGADIAASAVSTKKSYLYGVGGRKTAVSQVRLYKNGSGQIMVNAKPLEIYFPYNEFQTIVRSPLERVGQMDKLDVSARVKGGGIHAQAEAVRHGLSLALTKLNQNFRKNLKKVSFLTRDARMKERKKPGLKRARRAPQWQKR
ncbi:30S ribosomal protein S9 [Candidatus Uhrbacteria bacterium]|nr:30S ribosomal protein S9 [Candidatus Uhrbacteria bacterium]